MLPSCVQCYGSVRFFMDTYLDLADPDSDPTHLLAIAKKNNFLNTTLLIKSLHNRGKNIRT
jgi:hypothetical protein